MPERPPLGVIAAGHPVSASAGAEVLREGGNAVDAALAAMFTSFVCEPLLTGLGAGGYMLIAGPERSPALLDFFVEAPGRGSPPRRRAELIPIDVSFGDAVQVFNIGVASVGAYGMPAGVTVAAERHASLPLADLAAPAVALARDGVEITEMQGYLLEILAGIVTATPEARALFAPGGRLLRAGDVLRQPQLADALQRLGAEGAAPFYSGDIAAAVTDWVSERGGTLTPEDLDAYGVADRDPVRIAYRGREVLTNAPPSAGGILIAYALARLAETSSRPTLTEIVAAMEQAQAERTPDFLEGLSDPRFVADFLRTRARAGGGRLGSTTHISVLDADGLACSVTCSNGACSGVIVPGTGMHLNNMLGEQDLNPLGFHRHPPGRRMPSMMAPTIVLRDGHPELVLGSAGSNRIRSAILQTIVHAVDDGLAAGDAVLAPRAHFEDGLVYAEPGVDTAPLEAAGYTVSRFRARNLFFGGVQAVARDAAGGLSGGGDPRRGGAAIVVQ